MDKLKTFLENIKKTLWLFKSQVILVKELERKNPNHQLPVSLITYTLKEVDLNRLGAYLTTIEYGQPFTIDEARNRLRNNQICIVAEIENNIVGFLWLASGNVYLPYIGYYYRVSENEMLVYGAHVDKEQRGKNIFGVMLNAAYELMLFGKNIKRLIALIYPWNKRSLRAFRKDGFRPVGRFFYGRFMGINFSFEIRGGRVSRVNMRIPVLLYLDDTGNSLSVMRELAHAKIPVYAFSASKKNISFKSRYGKKDICPPPPNEREFVDFLIKKASSLNVKPLFIPTTDSVVKLLIKYQNELKKYILLPFEDPDTIYSLLDKHQLADICEKNSIPHPKTYFWKAENHNREPAITDMAFPVLIKPVYHGKIESFHNRKLFIIKDKKDWEYYIGLIKRHKVDIIIQERLHARHYFAFYACFDGRKLPSKYLMYEKILQYPDEFGTGVVCKVVRNEQVRLAVQDFIDKCPFHSIAEIELLEEEGTGNIYLIEVNPRSIVQNSLAVKVGSNVILDTYFKITGEEDTTFQTLTDDVIWIDEGGLLSYLLEKGKINSFVKGGLATALRERRVSFCYFDLRDLLPFFYFLERTLCDYAIRALSKFAKSIIKKDPRKLSK